LLERVVELAVVRLGRRVGQVVVVRSFLPRLVHQRARMVVVQVLDRGHDAPALLEQRFTKVVRVDGAHAPRSCPAADERRRSISPGSTPASSTILSRAPCPETSVTDVRGIASVSASRRIAALFARPGFAVAATRTFPPSPLQLATRVPLAPVSIRSMISVRPADKP